MAGPDALKAAESDQTGRPGGSRGMEVEGYPRLVSRRDDMYRGDLQERREDDLRQGSIIGGILFPLVPRQQIDDAFFANGNIGEYFLLQDDHVSWNQRCLMPNLCH